LCVSQRRAHQRNYRGNVPHNQLSRNTQDPVPGTPKVPVLARISRGTSGVTTAIKLNSQFDAGCCEVRNVVSNDHLAPKCNAKLFAWSAKTLTGLKSLNSSGALK
jgi:hypothetical protein